jgi:hypothetical protein
MKFGFRSLAILGVILGSRDRPERNMFFTTFDVPGSTATQALGINGAGQIVGRFASSGNDSLGFLLSGGIYTTLDAPWANQKTIADGINDSGVIVGSYLDTNGVYHGFLANAVPEPSGLILLTIGAGAIGALRVVWGWKGRPSVGGLDRLTG